MLNLIYAMKIFGHRSVESFRRELSRNSQLRIACGLSEGKYKYLRERKHQIHMLVKTIQINVMIIELNMKQHFHVRHMK